MEFFDLLRSFADGLNSIYGACASIVGVVLFILNKIKKPAAVEKEEKSAETLILEKNPENNLKNPKFRLKIQRQGGRLITQLLDLSYIIMEAKRLRLVFTNLLAGQKLKKFQICLGGVNSILPLQAYAILFGWNTLI